MDLIASVLVFLVVVYGAVFTVLFGLAVYAATRGSRRPVPEAVEVPPPAPPSSSWRVIPRGLARCERCRGLVLDDALAELYAVPRHDPVCARRTARESAAVEQLLRHLGLAEPDPVDVANAAHDELSGGAP